MSHCNIGVLASPFMRAALVIDVDPAAVTAPRVRPARYPNNFKNGSCRYSAADGMLVNGLETDRSGRQPGLGHLLRNVLGSPEPENTTRFEYRPSAS